MSSYKDLVVWQKAIKLVVEIYRVTEGFPQIEQYGLISQMRRCSVSIPSNIAEGQRRRHKAEFRQFLTISYGSGGELETQIIISKLLPFGKDLNFVKADMLLEEIMKMLNIMIKKLI